MAIQLTLAAVQPPLLPKIPLSPLSHPPLFHFGNDPGLVEINRGIGYPRKSRTAVIPAAGAAAQVEYVGYDPIRIRLEGDLPMLDWRSGLTPDAIRRNNSPLYPLNIWRENENKVRLLNYPAYLDYPDGEFTIEEAGPRGQLTPPFLDGVPLIYRWHVILLGG